MPPHPPAGQTRNPNRGLGQYFTAPGVVQFMFDMVRALGSIPEQAPRIVDPACGSGAFLLYALRSRFTASECIFGVEQDEAMRRVWEDNGLKDALGNHLYVQDGLRDTEDGEVCADSFDLVIGNPPFGVRVEESINYDGAEDVLRRLTIWRRPGKHGQGTPPALDAKTLTPADRKRLARFPVEILFLERFVELARAGGQIAVILPDGVFSNARHQYVRDWVQRRCQLQAVISLPTAAFRGAKTAAKTSILFCRRRRAGEKRSRKRVLLAALTSAQTKDDFMPILAAVTGKDSSPGTIRA